ncbi:RNA dependent RNA polymerase-domain-containing protein [Dichomitus squalens]|uniref:RNA-dependent RNA polymerase n=1 Tax=Dichomitus squalens TaxID=114155 RepID=A0A4Q9PUF0_9APHY|nr:RNA dependent RNA polymerase-domain-containing protein [Dichomitus squalens]
MAESDSEREFWEDDSLSRARAFLSMSKQTSSAQEWESEARDSIPRKEAARPTRATADIGIGTRSTDAEKDADHFPVITRRRPVHDTTPRPPIRSPAASTPQAAQAAASIESPRAHVRAAHDQAMDVDSDSEDDSAYDDLVIDTESEDSEVPSRGPSFAFSTTVESRNASMTSLSSSASMDSSGRKRTGEYEPTYGRPIIPGPSTTRRKVARTTQQTATLPSPRPVPQTPSRSGNVTRTNWSESPAPYRETIDTPTTSRISNAVGALGLDEQPSSASVGPSRTKAQTQALDPSSFSGVYILAHDKDMQKLFDKIPLSWGVQYEIARGVSLGLWSWDTVRKAKLESLRGPNNNAASRVSQVLGRPLCDMSPSDAAIWIELDREDAAIIENRSRGLGLQGDFKEKPNWYGGQIQQIARLESDGESFRLTLAKMEMRKSYRFARFLHSRRIIQVSIPQSIVNNRAQDLRAFFTQKFVLCGRVFVAFDAKDKKMFLMEIPEQYERDARVPGDEHRISLEDFVAWHNPMHRNGQQPISKWATRFDLGFSVSVPVISIALENMHFMKDEAVLNDDQDWKPPPECILTDGCGWMNGAALSALAKQIGLEERPTAVQGRFGGAKGLWILHPREQSSNGAPKIWIRDSQVKVKLDLNNLHPAHTIFDLLAPPRVTLPSRLSKLTVLNLAYNGVPKETFVELMKDTIEEEVKPLTQWTGPKAMFLLWKAVERVGGVSMKRALQHALGTSRALGLIGRSMQDLVDRDDEPPEALEQLATETSDLGGDVSEETISTYTALRDPITGQPLTIHGVSLDLIQAGFNPLKLEFLYEKLKKIVTMAIDDIISDYHISVPLSAEAFIIPDPYGILNEREIHFKSTKNLKDPLEDMNPHQLLGEVLIYRNPCRLPSDVQKVTAVQCDVLAAYTDVIVLPTVGARSFASYLAGGDVAVVIYDDRLVKDFTTPPVTQEPPDFIKNNFEDMGTIKQVSDLAKDLTQLDNDPDARRRMLQESLLSGLSITPIGMYSEFHEGTAYAYGYDAPETIRNAFMFNTVLDSRKTGYRIRQEVLKDDKRKYQRQLPDCMLSRKAAEKKQQSWDRGDIPFRRDRRLGQFILDELFAAGRKMRDEQITRYDRLKSHASFSMDDDLLRPWKRVRPWLGDSSPVARDLEAIQRHVEKHIERWRAITANARTPFKRGSSSAKDKATGSESGKGAQAQYNDLARSFATGPDISPDTLLASIASIAELKASCAYTLKPGFAWSVAFQALCHIKAGAQGSVAVTADFAEVMSIPASTNRVLEQSRLALTS